MLAEGVRQAMQGRMPRVEELLLTPANMQRVADRLAEMRGAAMKIGQLLSMDAGDLMPTQLSDILSTLRAEAQMMPMSQLVGVLEASWGSDWQNRFARFSFSPLAAASIGQVHLARSLDGRELAIKVQYPGIRRSIDSDVDNVAMLLRVSGLLPQGMDLEPMLAEAKRQLHAEADYRLEAGHLTRYRELLADTPEFEVPSVDASLSGETILAMSCVGGVGLESLATADWAERERAVSLLFSLFFRELFEFGLVQTDPNFANYRYDPANGKLALLDFGATRAFSPSVVAAYRDLMVGAARRDRALVDRAAMQIGYFGAGIAERQRRIVIELFLLACEPLRHDGRYDFSGSRLASRIRDAGLALSTERELWHSPPPDALFLHRKLGGLYLLAARLGARVDVRAIASVAVGGL
jgi:predicted unusual protein kinase regulating ubiquinone biosynthesis (AarF/ABC1/UbiB family)